ncbi:MAG TPA: hypothetical protein VMV95_02590 [Bacillota bacterium]|nr:hypothetical protein [Bacillota bacterium]
MSSKKELKRKNVYFETFQRVEKFLKEQKEPLFKADLVRKLGVDLNSLKLILEKLPVKIDKEGRIKLCSK